MTIKIGDIITVQERSFSELTHDGIRRVDPPKWSAKVLATWAYGGYICEGLTPQSAMHPDVQEACKAAGIDPNQRIRLAYHGDIVGEILLGEGGIASLRDQIATLAADPDSTPVLPYKAFAGWTKEDEGE